MARTFEINGKKFTTNHRDKCLANMKKGDYGEYLFSDWNLHEYYGTKDGTIKREIDSSWSPYSQMTIPNEVADSMVKAAFPNIWRLTNKGFYIVHHDFKDMPFHEKHKTARTIVIVYIHDFTNYLIRIHI